MGRKTIDFGIDLGTTNSAIAVMQDGAPQIIKNSLTQADVTPSAVKIDKRGIIHVGEKAYRGLIEDPENTAAEFKLAMGRKRDAEYRFKASGRCFSAGELSAEVLKLLRSDAEQIAGDVNAAIITVPAMFSAAACDETREAAERSGFQQIALLQEPVAAALAYGLTAESKVGNVLVYDLGGGTFDSCLMACKLGRFVVLGNAGDEHLGGKEFDWLIFNFFVQELREQGYEVDGMSREDTSSSARRAVALLKFEAEQAKKHLSIHEKYPAEIKNLGSAYEDIDIVIEISRNQFESLIARYVESTLLTCEALLESKKLKRSDIDKVLLVGGPTRIPLIRHALRERFGDAVEANLDPMTVVAKGAAVFAATQKLETPASMRSQPMSALSIKVIHNPSSPNLEEQIGLVLGPEHESATVELVRADGGWSSGAIPVPSNRKISLTVSLRSKKANTFEVVVKDRVGGKIPVSEPEFTITHGLPNAQVTLSRSIGVALAENDFEVIVAKDSPLPARGSYKLRTVTPCSPQSDPIKVYLLEGEHARADRNIAIGLLNIAPKARTIPTGQEVQVTLHVNESRQLRATAFVPLTNEAFEEAVECELHSESLTPQDATKEIGQETWRVEKFKEHLDSKSLSGIERLFADCQQELSAAKGEDQAARSRLTRKILELKAVIDSAYARTERTILNAELAEWEEMVQDLDENLTENERSSLKACQQKAADASKGPNLESFRESLTAFRRQLRSIVYSRDWYWLSRFKILQDSQDFVDMEKARRLMEEGARAVKRGDIEALQTIVWDLWRLQPSWQYGDLDGRFDDAGVARAHSAGK